MNEIALTELRPKLYFTKYLYLDEGYVLLAPETPVTPELIARLTRWEFRNLKTEGVPTELITGEEEGEAPAEEAPRPAENGPDDERLEGVRASTPSSPSTSTPSTPSSSRRTTWTTASSWSG